MAAKEGGMKLEATAVSREATLDGGDVKPEPPDPNTEEVQRKPPEKTKGPTRRGIGPFATVESDRSSLR
jgi:hypothetical protein